MINIATITFDSTPMLNFKDIEHFRGAIISLYPETSIYHNHDNSSYIYTYPLIQYKIIDDKPALVGIGEGAESLDASWKTGDCFKLKIGHRSTQFCIDSKEIIQYSPTFTKSTYIIKNWLPFNQENYRRYKIAESLDEKIVLMKKLLIGNILSLYKGLGIWIDEKIHADIVEIIKSTTIKYKGIELISMDVKITTNLTLPTYCGIGKGVSKGYGTIIKCQHL